MLITFKLEQKLVNQPTQIHYPPRLGIVIKRFSIALEYSLFLQSSLTATLPSFQQAECRIGGIKDQEGEASQYQYKGSSIIIYVA